MGVPRPSTAASRGPRTGPADATASFRRMQRHPEYALEARDEIAALVARHPWAVVTSAPEGVPIVSHAPVLLDSVDGETVTISGHLGRRDAELHRLGEVETVVVIQGPHGYVTPSWYPTGTYVPTWNFVAAHLVGRVEVLDAEATWDVLVRTVERFEGERPEPWQLDSVSEYAHRIAPGTVGFRLRTDRIEAKAKLSQDEPDEVMRSVIANLDTDEVHGDAQLAAAMRHHLSRIDEERA
jgi:transcriptional regulator